MARQRTVPDAEIFAIVRRLLRTGGDRGVTFSLVAGESGLSGASLVQRYTSRDGMVLSARLAGWDRLDGALSEADAAAPAGADGAAALLKALAAGGCGEDLVLLVQDLGACPERAAAWRMAVEAALARRLGGDAEAARAAFALWQGRLLWTGAGGKGPKLRAAVQRLAGVRPDRHGKPAKGAKPKKAKAAKAPRKTGDRTPDTPASAAAGLAPEPAARPHEPAEAAV